MSEWREINAIAKSRGIMVIEDSAQSIGSGYDGKMAGSFGDTGVFSFHGTKTMTTGEGGMLVTDDKAIYERCRFLADHGRVSGEKMFWNSEIAYKYKMSAMQAALGLAQLERIEELVQKKREIFAWYEEELRDVAGLTLNAERTPTKNSFWMTTIIVGEIFGIEKEYLIREMKARGINCRPFFYPLSSLPAYAYLPHVEDCKLRNTNSYRISPYGINLPSALNMTQDKVKYVCEALRKILKQIGCH
jgi:perosamine synthetase